MHPQRKQFLTLCIFHGISTRALWELQHLESLRLVHQLMSASETETLYCGFCSIKILKKRISRKEPEVGEDPAQTSIGGRYVKGTRQLSKQLTINIADLQAFSRFH